jgi:Zn-dependent oligopeptidase
MIAQQQIANLLGFDDWADCQTADLLAGNASTAYAFIDDIGNKLSEKVSQEKNIILNAKRKYLKDESVDTVNIEDFSFYSTMVLKQEYNVDEAELTQYFEQEKTLRGIFDIYQRLFGISITRKDPTTPLWAEDVRYYEIYEERDGNPIGIMYLDLYPREGKYNWYAHFPMIPGTRITLDNGSLAYRAPVGTLLGNWPRPALIGNVTVSLWSFDEVISAFHELGHLLHNVSIIECCISYKYHPVRSHNFTTLNSLLFIHRFSLAPNFVP